MSLREIAEHLRDCSCALLNAVNAHQDDISLREARSIIHLARETEGYLKGIRERLS